MGVGGGASHLDVRVKQEGARVWLCHLELRVQRLQNNNNNNKPLIGPPCDWQAGWRLQLLLGTAARCVGDHVTKLAEHVPRNLA